MIRRRRDGGAAARPGRDEPGSPPMHRFDTANEISSARVSGRIEP